MAELSVAQMWSAPIPEGEPADAAEVDRLARQIAQRRVSVDEATAAAAAFVEGEEGAAREARLGYLYEAVLEQLNRERGAVIAGIGRYARHQAALSDRVEQERLALDEARRRRRRRSGAPRGAAAEARLGHPASSASGRSR